MKITTKTESLTTYLKQPTIDGTAFFVIFFLKWQSVTWAKNYSSIFKLLPPSKWAATENTLDIEINIDEDENIL